MVTVATVGRQGAWRVPARMAAAGLEHETQTCNALLRAAGRDAALAPDARALYERMRASGPPPDAMTLSALFSAAHRWGAVDAAWLLDVRTGSPKTSETRVILCLGL